MTIPDPYDEDAIARYAAEHLPLGDEVTEEYIAEWRRPWTTTAIPMSDLSAFENVCTRFPRRRLYQFSEIARRNNIGRDSLIRRLCAEYLIAHLDEPRADIEYDFPIYDWHRRFWGKTADNRAKPPPTMKEHEDGRPGRS